MSNVIPMNSGGPDFKPLQRYGVDLDPWMFMGLHDGVYTYKRYCEHDEHGGKEYLYLTRDGVRRDTWDAGRP